MARNSTGGSSTRPPVRPAQPVRSRTATHKDKPLAHNDKPAAKTTTPTAGSKPPSRRAAAAPTEKLQKVLARAGFGSRRELEQWIAEGRLTINGKVAGLGDRAAPADRICLDGKRLSMERLAGPGVRVLLYNKPVGEICTRSDPEGRPTVFDRLPALEKGRWIAVGRLDLNTSGLLLLVSDGELANRLMHPSAQIDREYLVRVMGVVDADMLKRLREGVQLDDGIARFTDIAPMRGDEVDSINRWYCCTLMEGRNREVRRLWESQGMRVSRLKRVRFGPAMLNNKLPEGRWQELKPNEIAILYQEAGLRAPVLKALTPEAKAVAERHERKPTSHRKPTDSRSKPAASRQSSAVHPASEPRKPTTPSRRTSPRR